MRHTCNELGHSACDKASVVCNLWTLGERCWRENKSGSQTPKKTKPYTPQYLEGLPVCVSGLLMFVLDLWLLIHHAYSARCRFIWNLPNWLFFTNFKKWFSFFFYLSYFHAFSLFQYFWFSLACFRFALGLRCRLLFLSTTRCKLKQQQNQSAPSQAGSQWCDQTVLVADRSGLLRRIRHIPGEKFNHHSTTEISAAL